jgi:hypothetical protein
MEQECLLEYRILYEATRNVVRIETDLCNKPTGIVVDREVTVYPVGKEHFALESRHKVTLPSRLSRADQLLFQSLGPGTKLSLYFDRFFRVVRIGARDFASESSSSESSAEEIPDESLEKMKKLLISEPVEPAT